MAGNRQPKTFYFLLQILLNIFLDFPKCLIIFNQFSLSSSTAKPKGSNNGDECVIISDSDDDDDEEQNSQNLGQEDDEGDEQVRGEVSFSHIV